VMGPLARVARVAGRGSGLLATRAIESGQVILDEQPLVRVSKNANSAAVRAHPVAAGLMQRVIQLASKGVFNPRDVDSWPAEVRQCMEGVLDVQAEMAFEKLPEPAREEWMALHDAHAEVEGRAKSPGGVLRTNAFDDDEGFANLYARLSRVNHSCAPNATRMAAEPGGSVRVLASQAIQPDEEVLISYLDGEDAGLAVGQRRQRLEQQFRFLCTCSLCARESSSGA